MRLSGGVFASSRFVLEPLRARFSRALLAPSRAADGSRRSWDAGEGPSGVDLAWPGGVHCTRSMFPLPEVLPLSREEPLVKFSSREPLRLVPEGALPGGVCMLWSYLLMRLAGEACEPGVCREASGVWASCLLRGSGLLRGSVGRRPELRGSVMRAGVELLVAVVATLDAGEETLQPLP